MKEALFYEKKEAKEVHCFLCNHNCRIPPEGLGICGVRQNSKGVLYSLNYGQVIASNIDPIEKKPLFHVLPGSFSYSIACVGCNFQCDFCQNWQISQAREAEKLKVVAVKLKAEDVVGEAIKNKCPSISYTYTEPTIYFEFAYDCCRLAKEKGLYNNFVTNGFMSKEALEYIAPYLDAANVDLKSHRQEFYKERCKAHVAPVLDNISAMKKLNIWVEVTTLVIPGLNDSDNELREIARLLASIDKNIPWHVSAFHPDYKLTDLKRTQSSALSRAYKIGKDSGLKFVYMGNLYSPGGEITYCPACAKPLIERTGFLIKQNNIKKGHCSYCQTKIEGVGL